MSSLSIIVASSGRPTLQRTLESITQQLRPGDELLVDVNQDAPWGHAARNRLMPRACGDALAFIDDDDIYLPRALEIIRASVALNGTNAHFFKMRYGLSTPVPGAEVWTQTELIEGQVSTCTIVVPNIPQKLGVWGSRYAGDFDFAASTVALHDLPPIWHEQTIAEYRP